MTYGLADYARPIRFKPRTFRYTSGLPGYVHQVIETASPPTSHPDRELNDIVKTVLRLFTWHPTLLVYAHAAARQLQGPHAVLPALPNPPLTPDTPLTAD